MTDGLTKSADVKGLRLLGRDGVKLGVVREFFVDIQNGDLAYLIVEGGGLLGGAGKFHPVPWRTVRYDPVAGSFQLPMGKDEFKAAPSYDREQLGASGYDWSVQADRYFEAASEPLTGSAQA